MVTAHDLVVSATSVRPMQRHGSAVSCDLLARTTSSACSPVSFGPMFWFYGTSLHMRENWRSM